MTMPLRLLMLLSCPLLTAPVFTDSTADRNHISAEATAQTEKTMAIPNLAGKVLTVLGPVDPSVIGPALMHEHIFIDFQSPGPARQMRFASVEDSLAWEAPISISNMNRVRYGRGVRGGSFLGDFDEMYDEVMEFRKRGGQTIVDVSNIGLGRDPDALVRMSHATGMSIVMGSSWYIKQYHPLDMSERNIEELTDVIVRDVTVGAQGTGIRSGIIGEIGIDGGPLTPNEMKVIRASARASRITGAPMSFHAGGVNEERLVSIDASLAEGVRPEQIIMGHAGALTPNMPLIRKMLAKGVYLQIDWLGVIEGPAGIMGNRSDRTIASAIVELVREGYGNRILLSHDICTRAQLRKYGGTGFAYVTEYFVPELRRQGLSKEEIHMITVDNPQHALTFVEPRP